MAGMQGVQVRYLLMLSVWAGQANGDWSKGIVIKREVEKGDYGISWVSMKALERIYG